MSTFKKVLTELKPSVFFVEETKLKEEGKLKLENFVLFELVRESKDGGGLLLGCVKELKPVLVHKGNDEVEAISVDIFVKSMSIRCVVAYGCQENSLIEKKEVFWRFIEEEVITAWDSGSGFILQFDGNLWAGPEIVPGDPRQQNKNGKLFQEFLVRNKNLTVVNSLDLCQGVVTRVRMKEDKEERSVLDFFVVCSRVLPYVTQMVIDEEKKHILTNYKPARAGAKANDSDHFTEVMDVNLELIADKPQRKEIFNFKDKDSQAYFKEITSKTEEFSNCFDNNKPLEEQIYDWRKVLKTHCKTAFKNIRIKQKKRIKPLKPEMSSLINKRNKLKKDLQDEETIKKIGDIENSISEMEAAENREFIIENFKKFSENPEKINLQEMWKVLNRIGPKFKSTVPTAKLNHKRKLISNPDEIKKLLAKE